MKLNKLTLFACLLCLSVTAFAQNNMKTIEKPYQKWTKDEAAKILNSQPWADQYQSERGLASVAMQTQGREQSDNRLSGSERGSSSRNLQPPVIVIRLHSALAIRQANVRIQQLNAGYDKMSEADRAKFDESTKSFLNCAVCQNYYVVTLLKVKSASLGTVDDGLFQTMKYEDLKGKVWLVNDKNEKRELVQFTPPKGAGELAVFFFKRTDEKGAPLLTPENKEFKFVFSNDLLDNNNAYSGFIPRSFDFKVSKLIVGDKIEF